MSNKQIYKPADARPDLPFSAVTRLGDVLYVSGQVGIDPATKQVVDGGIGPQTRQTLENLKRALALANASLDDVVKCNVFLTDISEFAAFNAVYREYFPKDPPARTTVGTSGLSSPAMVVEIEAIAAAH
jgi:2-iminobutanoate/2-iminopropanoate deaminase